MAKPELEFHRPEAAWRPTAMPGFWEKILSEDPDTGAYTRLARLEPGTDTSAFGVIIHTFREEAYLMEGELTDLSLGVTFTPGMYTCRPAGMAHGPYRTDRGALLIEFRYDLGG